MDRPTARHARAVGAGCDPGDGTVEVPEVGLRVAEEGGDLLALEGDRLPLGVVLVVVGHRLRGLDDAVEVPSQGLDAGDGPLALTPQGGCVLEATVRPALRGEGGVAQSVGRSAGSDGSSSSGRRVWSVKRDDAGLVALRASAARTTAAAVYVDVSPPG